MDFLTLGVILVVGWVALVILVVALCTAASRAEANSDRIRPVLF